MRYTLLLAFLLVLGCKKDNKPGPGEKPKCRLESFSYLGDKYEMVYEGERIVQVGKGRYQLTYGMNGKLVTIERFDVPGRTELTYNNEGRVFLERRFEKRGEANWVEFSVFTYAYTNGKVTRINEIYPSMGLVFDNEVVWEGENIRSLLIRSNNAVVCTQQYTYDLSAANAVTPLLPLYYSDNSGGTDKPALYYSANRLTNIESTCPAAGTTRYGYVFDNNQRLQSISINGQTWYTYAYSNCP